MKKTKTISPSGVSAPKGYHWMKKGNGKYKLMKHGDKPFKPHKGASLKAKFPIQKKHNTKYEEGGEVERYQSPSFMSMFEVGSKMNLFGKGGPASERAKMRHERKMARQGARADRKMVRTEGRQERKEDRLAGRQEAGSRRQDRKDQRQDSRLGYYQKGGNIRKLEEGEELEKISRKDRRKLKNKKQVKGVTEPNDPKIKIKRRGRAWHRKNNPQWKFLSAKQKRELTGYEDENVSDYVDDKKRIDASLRKRFIGMKEGEARKNLTGKTVHQVLPEGVVSKKREKFDELNPGLTEENIAKGNLPYEYPEKKAEDDPNIGIYETKKSQEKRSQQKEGKKDTPTTTAVDDRVSVGTFPGTREDTMDLEETSGPKKNIPSKVDDDRKRRYVFNPKTGVYTEKEKRKSGFGYKKTGRQYVDEKYRQDAQEKKDIRERKESKEPTREQKKENKKIAKEEKAKQAEVARKAREEGKSSYVYNGITYNITPKVMKGGGTLMDQYNRKFQEGGVNMDEDQDGLPIGVDATPGGTMQGPTMPPNNNQMSISGSNLGEIKDPLANDEPEPDNLFEEDVNIENTNTGGNNINLQNEETNQGDMNQQDDSMDQGGMDQGQDSAGPTRAQLRHERKSARQQARADRRMVRTQARQQRKADRLAGRMEKRSRRQDRKDQRQEARISKREDRRFERQQKRNMRRRNRRGNFKHGGMVKGKKGAGLGIIIVVGRKSNKKGK